MANRKSPTQRTLEYCRQLGWQVEVVEKWIQAVRIRQDLFGVIDIVAVTDDHRIIGIQACAGASHAARRRKAVLEPRLRPWLLAGAGFEVWSWSKRGRRWTPRIEALALPGGTRSMVDPWIQLSVDASSP